MTDPVVTHVSGGRLAIPTATPSHQPYIPALLHQTKHWGDDPSEDKLMYSERQVRDVPHPATNKPKNEEFFVYDRNGVPIPNLDLIRGHFLAEGRLTEQQAMYILVKAIDLFSREPNLLSVPSPVIGESPYATSLHHCFTMRYLSLRRRSRPVREYRTSLVAQPIH